MVLEEIGFDFENREISLEEISPGKQARTFAGLMSRWTIPAEKISPISCGNPQASGSPLLYGNFMGQSGANNRSLFKQCLLIPVIPFSMKLPAYWRNYRNCSLRPNSLLTRTNTGYYHRSGVFISTCARRR
jgi:hypothetical protein